MPTKNLHPDSQDLVKELSIALANRLLRSQKKYGYSNNWLTDDWEDGCREDFMKHIKKGDPLDVIAYAAFMWKRGWKTC